jgi:DNA-binding NarL/FixJ family response regulator
MSRSKSKKPAAKVLIVDDHPAVREALAIRIAKLSDLAVCGEATDVADALKLVAEHKPDLAIIDISLKTGDGLDLIKRIRARDEKVRLLVWSMHSENHYAERALRAGAQGYITKEQATGQIVEAIRHVLDGKVYLSPAMTEKLLHRAVGEGGAALNRSSVDALSNRELEVLRLVGTGVRTGVIAKQLHLSIKTVETYRDRIRQKLELRDGMDLVRYATQWVLENA